MRRSVLLLVMLALVALDACQPAESVDMPATYAAEQQQIVAEETRLSAAIGTREAAISATAYAAETYVVDRNRINQQLLATARVADPPTRQVIALNPGGQYAVATPGVGATGSAPSNPGATALPDAPAAGQFTNTTTARTLRPEDGCPLDSTTTFSTDDAQIYVVTRALDVSAGTQMAVEWSFEGAVADTATFTLPNDEQDFCIYFFLDTFSPGNWSVTLNADGTPVAPAISFTVTAAGE